MADPNDDLVKSEQRAAQRRATEAKQKEAEAEAEVQRQINAQKEKAQQEAHKAALLPKVAALREQCAGPVKSVRERAQALRVQAEALERIAGDLEGAIITAGDVARIDPQRALDGLQRAQRAFEHASRK